MKNLKKKHNISIGILNSGDYYDMKGVVEEFLRYFQYKKI